MSAYYVCSGVRYVPMLMSLSKFRVEDSLLSQTVCQNKSRTTVCFLQCNS